MPYGILDVRGLRLKTAHLKPIAPLITVERVLPSLSASLRSIGLLTPGAPGLPSPAPFGSPSPPPPGSPPPAPSGSTPLAVKIALEQFQREHALPVTGVLGHEDILEIAAALHDRGFPTGVFTKSLQVEDPEAFGHDVEWPVVSPGQKSTAVRLIQLRVNQLGYGSLVVDGDFGPNTATAVRAAQKGLGLIDDGIVGKKSWHALLAGASTLSPGSTGEAVRIAQMRLKELAYADFEATGNFGPKTLASLHSFQTESGLPPSDVIVEETWRYLLGTSFASTPTDGFATAKAELNQAVASGVTQLPEAVRAAVTSVMSAGIASYGIRESPEGSNRGPEVDALVGTRGWAWCALSVSAWLRRGLNVATWTEIPFKKEMASVNAIRDWGFTGGRFLPADGVPPGAIFICNRTTTEPTAPSVPFSNGHTGLVVEDQGDAVATIEGNSHDSVRSVVRPKSTLVGCVRWWD